MRPRIACAALIALAFVSTYAFAAPLAVISTSGAKAGDHVASGTSTGEKYAIPGANDLVRVCGQTCNWDDASFVWRRFADLATTARIDACTTDGVAIGASSPRPWNPATEPCKEWKAVEVSTFSTSSYTSPLQLDWSVVDGAIGYRILHGSSIAAMHQVVEVRPSKIDTAGCSPVHGGRCIRYALEVPEGTRSIAVRAFDAVSESPDSGVLNLVVRNSAPAPPVLPSPVLTITTQGYDLTKSNDRAAWKLVGTVPAGSKMLPFSAVASDGVRRCGVARSALRLAAGVTTRPSMVFVAC